MPTPVTPWWAVRYEAMAALHPAFAGEIDLLAEAQVESLVAVLGLHPGAAVLDIGCGAGRHAVLLQELGMAVTGVDLSPRILRLAKAAWDLRHPDLPGPQLIPGDMRWLPVEGPFDAAVYMDMALGVFEEEEAHLRSLRSCFGVLRPGGAVLVELFNPFYWAREPRTQHFPPGRLVDGADVVRRYRFDAVRGRIEDRVLVFREGRREELPVQSLRAWSPPEIRRLLEEAGFHKVGFLGSQGWEPPEVGTPIVPHESALMWVVGRVP